MKKIKVKAMFTVLTLLLVTLSISNVYAAGYSVSAGSKSLTVGGTTSLYIDSSKEDGCTGRFNISSDNSSVVSVDTSTMWLENSKGTIKLTANGSGSATITVTPVDVTDTKTGKETISDVKTVTVSVKAKETTNNQSSTSTLQTTTTKKPTTTSTSTKSSNANIIGLSLDVEGLDPSFKKSKTSYKLNVDSKVDKLKIKVSLEDSSASYKITGNKDFKEGENIVKIKVTAEDKKTTKTYKITVNKAPDLTLASLVIGNAELKNEFDSDVLEYTLTDVENDIMNLDITATPTNEKAIVKIAGNDSLVDGANVIKIVISDESGNNTKVYTLNVNKLSKVVPAISEDVEIVEQNSYLDGIKSTYKKYEGVIKQNATVILLYILALVEFLQVVYLYRQLKMVDPNFDKITVRRRNNGETVKRRRTVDIDIDVDKNKD